MYRTNQWQEAIMDWTDVKVQNLTMAFPLKSRHVGDVANVLSAMYCKLRSLGMPLHRVHTDRAREFTGRQLAQWFRQRDVVHTTSAGDESQGCARVEAEIGYLKSRTRLLLGSAKVDTSLWPLALRHAGEHNGSEARWPSLESSFPNWYRLAPKQWPESSGGNMFGRRTSGSIPCSRSRCLVRLIRCPPLVMDTTSAVRDVGCALQLWFGMPIRFQRLHPEELCVASWLENKLRNRCT